LPLPLRRIVKRSSSSERGKSSSSRELETIKDEPRQSIWTVGAYFISIKRNLVIAIFQLLNTSNEIVRRYDKQNCKEDDCQLIRPAHYSLKNVQTQAEAAQNKGKNINDKADNSVNLFHMNLDISKQIYV